MFPCKDISLCTGCAACVASCPICCIEMQEDQLGRLVPAMDVDKCIKCGLCQNICPVNNLKKYEYPKKCFAAWNSNQLERSLSASGGVAYLLSKYVITEKKGVVFGVSYNESMLPIITSAKTLEELEAFKGSKYVQAIFTREVYMEIKALLQNGIFVLFIGTPCEVVGLYSVLGTDDFNNLLTVDLICHGVSPTRYFIEEINYLKSNKKWELIDVRFRGNDDCKYSVSLLDKCLGKTYKGNNYCFTLWTKRKDGSIQRVYRGNRKKNMYLRGFIDGITLRENCYRCEYARPDRVADITLGDFIGLGKHQQFPFSAKNVSSVLVNTKKGLTLYEDILFSNKELFSIERDYNERLIYKPALCEACKKHPLNYKFVKIYPKVGYVDAIRQVLWLPMLRENLKDCLLTFYRLPFLFLRKIYTIFIKKFNFV